METLARRARAEAPSRCTTELAVVKLVAGVTGHSFALVADAVESLGDIFSSAIVWGGLVIASKPADADHRTGTARRNPSPPSR